MAKKFELEIEINDLTGEVIIDAIGFKGKMCENIQDQIAEALGGMILEKKDKLDKKERPVKEISIIKSGSK